MIGILLLWYIGLRLSVPTWYFVTLGISFVCKIISFGFQMYKLGAE